MLVIDVGKAQVKEWIPLRMAGSIDRRDPEERIVLAFVHEEPVAAIA